TVVLTWEAPDLTLTSEPTGYNIYNNDVLLATVAELTYTDAAMVNGANNYCVESVYGDAVSGQVCQAIEYYYPPVNLVLNAINNTVEITWDAPDPVVALPDAYSIYKNGTLLVDGITATSYVDEVPEGKSSTLIYGVTAVYAVNESLAVEGSVDYSGIGSGESDIMVYPNPVNSMLFIESEGSISARIYNAAGQLVEVKKGKDLIQVNTSNYATGIYSVDVITNERVTKTKFVVSR
ncbi:MAG: T9SS type A sorting domain-containing protein, partial [Bacteroidales bacterium]|nr:T9SS type A sorting domain-containing protein [Bacteroidales bacterium]